MNHPILTLKAARAAGLTRPVSVLVPVLHASQLTSMLDDLQRGGIPSALVLVKGIQRSGWVCVQRLPAKRKKRPSHDFADISARPKAVFKRQRRTTDGNL